MSLGVGASLGVSKPGEVSTTLDTVVYGMNGSEIVIGIGALGVQLEAIWTSDERSDEFENHIAPEDGVVKTCYMNVYSNTTVEDVPVYLSETTSKLAGHLDHQGGTYSDLVMTIPAGATGVFSATGLNLPLIKGRYYAFVFDPNGVNPLGVIGHHQSYRMEFGNNPVTPSKFCKLNRRLELGASDTVRQFNFNRNIKTGGLTAWGIPLPFNGKMSSVTISKQAAPSGASVWECRIYKNGIIDHTENLALNLDTVVFDPDIDMIKGDIFAFEISKSIAFGNSSFTVLSCGWSEITD